MRTEPLEWFVVRQISDGAGAAEEAIAHADPRVVHEHRGHVDLSDLKLAFLQLGHVDVSGHVPHTDRKIRAFHLRGQSGMESFTRTFVSEDPHLVLRTVGRNEKREPLDVIPVRMRNQQGQVDGLVVEFLRQRQTERPDAASRVEDNDFAVGTDFHARSIAAVPHRARAGRRNRPAHAPEFESRRLVGRQTRVGWGRRSRRGSGGWPASLPEIQNPGQVIGLERLDQAFVGADFDGAAPVGRVNTPSGDDDFGLLHHAGSFANGAANLKAVAARHEQAANHCVRLKLNGDLDTFFAIGGLEHTPAGATQPLGYQLAETGIVVNYQNGLHCATGRHGSIPGGKEQVFNRQVKIQC